MADPFIGEIRQVGFTFAPQDWAFCDGQLLPISQNSTLFSLLGTNYGGDGVSTFALPDLRGRIPLHAGASPGASSYLLAQSGGAESVTLNSPQNALHSHTLSASSVAASAAAPAPSAVPAAAATSVYSAAAPATAMSATGAVGAGQSHGNLMPFVCVNFIISLQGIYPSQN